MTADARTLSACPNCGHDWHPSGAAGSCAVSWMGERCGCRRMSLPDRGRFRAELSGSSWAIGPMATFATIRECRRWAEAYGTTADRCTIAARSGRVVALHVRDTSGDGTRWYRSDPGTGA
ncbi:MAG: hypothetical protein Q8M74_02915 [Chloroflexota bacterium]|nr:hypothetical protein [Chloroflexota bacterium]